MIAGKIISINLHTSKAFCQTLKPDACNACSANTLKKNLILLINDAILLANRAKDWALSAFGAAVSLFIPANEYFKCSPLVIALCLLTSTWWETKKKEER